MRWMHLESKKREQEWKKGKKKLNTKGVISTENRFLFSQKQDYKGCIARATILFLLLYCHIFLWFWCAKCTLGDDVPIAFMAGPFLSFSLIFLCFSFPFFSPYTRRLYCIAVPMEWLLSKSVWMQRKNVCIYKHIAFSIPAVSGSVMVVAPTEKVSKANSAQ